MTFTLFFGLIINKGKDNMKILNKSGNLLLETPESSLSGANLSGAILSGAISSIWSERSSREKL